jgi:hypothetical protein
MEDSNSAAPADNSPEHSDIVHTTNESQNSQQIISQGKGKVYSQQVFHKSFFEPRPRSNSLHGPSSSGSGLTNQVQALTNNMQPAPPATVRSSNETPTPPAWQRAPQPKKRKFTNSPPPVASAISTQNRYENLPMNQNEENADTLDTTKLPCKPPPIVLYGIEDINELSKLLDQAVVPQCYKLKIVNKNLLRILIDTTENYKTIIEIIRKNGLIGHTFTRKDMKCYRIVIKNLHHTTPHSAITEAIESTGNKVSGEIINSRYGPEKKPTTTFFVNVEPSNLNKELKNITYIYHQRIKIEEARKSKTLVQCKRCQQLGHTKNNCMRPYRCVKCGESHKSSECKKDRNSPARCALCSCDHPANFKGCEIYKQIAARRNKEPAYRGTTMTHPIITPTAPVYQHTTSQTIAAEKCTSEKYTYAEKTAGASNQQTTSYNQQTNTTLENLLIKQSEKMDLLIQQIGSLVGLITTLVTKLAK